jgi:hypothetical protein
MTYAESGQILYVEYGRRDGNGIPLSAKACLLGARNVNYSFLRSKPRLLCLFPPPPLSFQVFGLSHLLFRQTGVANVIELHHSSILLPVAGKNGFCQTLSNKMRRAIFLFCFSERVSWHDTRIPVGLCNNWTLFSVLFMDCPPGPLPVVLLEIRGEAFYT